MKAILLGCVLIAQPALALTFSSADQQDMLAVNGNFKYQLGTFGYQDQEPNKAQAVTGNDQFSLGLAGSSRLNHTVTLIGELSWDLFTDSQTDAPVYVDQAWLGARLYDRLSLTLGRSESPYGQITDLTDVFNIFGGQGYRYQKLNLDDQFKVTYYQDNLDIRVAYAKQDQNKADANFNTQAQYGASVGYRANNGLGAVLAIDNKASLDKDSDILSVALGVSYLNNKGLYAALTHNRSYYQEAWDVREIDSWESVVSYTYHDFALGLGYNRIGLAKPTVETWTSEFIVAGEYYLAAQAKVYAEVLLNQIDNQEPLYGVGMEFYF